MTELLLLLTFSSTMRKLVDEQYNCLALSNAAASEAVAVRCCWCISFFNLMHGSGGNRCSPVEAQRDWRRTVVTVVVNCLIIYAVVVVGRVRATT